MSDGVKIYGRDEALNARETMTTEQILAAIQRAITTGEVTDEFTAFIETIKEQNKGIGVKMWLGTQDEFNALEKTESNTIYFVYTTVIKDISDGIQELYDGLMDGTIKVYAATNADEATHATNADEATHATSADNVSSTINGKAISSIFESDGVTAKNATTADIANSVAQSGRMTKLWEGSWSGGETISVNDLDSYGVIMAKVSGLFGMGSGGMLPFLRAAGGTFAGFGMEGETPLMVLFIAPSTGVWNRLKNIYLARFNGNSSLTNEVTVTEIWGVEATKLPE